MNKIKREALIVITVLAAFIAWTYYSMNKFQNDVYETVMASPATTYHCNDWYDERGEHTVHSDGGVYVIEGHTYLFIVNGERVGNVGTCTPIPKS